MGKQSTPKNITNAMDAYGKAVGENTGVKGYRAIQKETANKGSEMASQALNTGVANGRTVNNEATNAGFGNASRLTSASTDSAISKGSQMNAAQNVAVMQKGATKAIVQNTARINANTIRPRTPFLLMITHLSSFHSCYRNYRRFLLIRSCNPMHLRIQ